MRLVILGVDPPGRVFCEPDGSPLESVHVGVQVGRDPHGLVRGDTENARWEFDVRTVLRDDGSVDFRGSVVQGRVGERFVYLTWGNLGTDETFRMFRRAKLMLSRVDPAVAQRLHMGKGPLVAVVRLRDGKGHPRCARVDPPDITWSIG